MNGSTFVQAVGLVCVIGFGVAVSFVVLRLLAVAGGLRVSEEHEKNGLDISAHGGFGYPDRFTDVPGARPGSGRAMMGDGGESGSDPGAPSATESPGGSTP